MKTFLGQLAYIFTVLIICGVLIYLFHEPERRFTLNVTYINGDKAAIIHHDYQCPYLRNSCIQDGGGRDIVCGVRSFTYKVEK